MYFTRRVKMFVICLVILLGILLLMTFPNSIFTQFLQVIFLSIALALVVFLIYALQGMEHTATLTGGG
jgi:predicted RND superfamily exporter protein